MIRTLKLQGYRGFKSFSLPNLKRVNLLVGNNNCGKTSILEALEFLEFKGDPSVLVRLADRRGEHVVPDGADSSERPTVPDISHLFFERYLEPGVGFHIVSDETGGAVHVELLARAEIEDAIRSNPHEWQRSIFWDGSELSPAFGLKISGIEPDRALVLPVTESGVLTSLNSILFQRIPPRMVSGERPVQLLTPSSLRPQSMRDMWDTVLTEGRESEVINAIRLLESDVESIHFLSGATFRSTSGGVLVGFRGGGRRLPLGSFGDGMRRLLALSLSLVRTRNGVLLIDEIDTGLHFSVMEEMWKLVVATALESNVQVAATTHSYDCIQGLAALLESTPEFAPEVSVQKIERSLAESVSLDAEQIRVAVRQDIEVR